MIYKEADYSLLKFAFTRHPVFFLCVHVFIIGGPFYLVARDQWHWMFAVVEGGALVGYWIGTWFHRRKLQRLNTKGSGSPHLDEVCEYCTPPRWKSGKPLNMKNWYMATRHVSEADAAEAMMLARLNDELGKLVLEHAKYLDHPYFDKFKTK